MEIILKHLWVGFIVGAIMNAVRMKRRTKQYRLDDPSLARGYDLFFIAMIIYGCLPWSIAGFGILTGLAEGTFDFFNPATMNPIVLLFYFAVIAIGMVITIWIYLLNGAEFIESHPEIVQVNLFGNRTHFTARQVKLFYPVMAALSIAVIVLLWKLDIPSPAFSK